MRAFVRVAAVAATAGLLLGPAATAASAAGPGPAAQVPVRSGTTRITTVSGIPGLLLLNKIAVMATDPGTETLINGVRLFAGPIRAAAPRSPAFRFSFPVSGGSVGLRSLSGHINDRGGILIVNVSNDRQVLVGRFIINLGRKTMSGIINGDPRTRTTLFRLDLSHAQIHVSGRTVHVSRVGLRLTSAAATALDIALNTTSFTHVSRFGTLSGTLHF